MKIAFSTIALLLLTTSVFCQNAHTVIPEDWYGGMKYRNVGPIRGGRATAVAGFADQPFTFLMGSTGGGVWKTDDAGQNWTNISDGQIKAGSIGAIAIAPSDPNVIYVGTGSGCPRGNISQGIGAYRSTDAGKTWKHIGLPKAGLIGKIEVHPNNPDCAFVAALGGIFGPNPERGIYRTKDGGKNWDKVLFVSDSTGFSDVALNPANPREIYAAAWRAERKPWTLVDGGHQGGIWKSNDGGDTWEKLGGGLPTGLLGKIGLAVSPANPQRIWAIIIAANEEDAGLYRSDDAGNTWSRICRDHKLRQRGWYYAHVTADPQDENTVYVNNVDFFKSIDGGAHFDIEIGVPHGDNHGLWINPHNPKIMIHCNDGGATVTLNGGATWSTEHNQPTSEFYRVTVDNQFPYRLYAGQQDNTTISIPSHDPGGLTDYQHWYDVGGSECGDVGVHHTNPDIVWGGSYSGEITIQNRRTGQERQVTAYPHYTEGTEQRKLKYRWQWNFPIVVSKFDPNVVYHGANVVFKTTTNGQKWDIISPDLSRKLDKYHDIPGGPIQHDATGVEVYSSVFTLEESPFKAGELWAGSDDGLIHITTDGGANWKNITPKNIPVEATINKLWLSTHTPGRAFAAVQNYRNNDFKPYILRTNDYGQSWELLSNNTGIPNDHFVRAIAEDPDRRGLLYAGTEYGMYVSFDDGKNWQSLQLNLPHTPITDIEVHEKDLAISTQGRAFWVLDDLTPLHQLQSDLAKSANFFFKPRAAYRTSVQGYTARFNFYLKEDPTKEKPLTIEILDGSGKVIRTLSTKADSRLNRIEAQKGFNTVIWNLRHEGPFLVDNFVTFEYGNPAPGPRVVPGDYQVRISVGAWQQNHTLTVLNDPRWTDVTNAHYAEQLALAQEMRQLLSESQQRIVNLRSLREQISNLAKLAVKTGLDKAIETKAEALGKQLTEVEDQIIQNKIEASQDAINYPRVFSNHLLLLYAHLVESHDRPTEGIRERFADLKSDYAKIVGDYNKVIEQLPAFNALLDEQKAPRLMTPERW